MPTIYFSFDRPNIRYRIVQKQNTREQLHLFEAEHPKTQALVYCLSRKRVEETANGFVKKLERIALSCRFKQCITTINNVYQRRRRYHCSQWLLVWEL